VTGASRPAASAFIRAVADDSIDLYTSDVDPFAPGLYLVPASRRWLLHGTTTAGLVNELLACATTARIDVLVPTLDDELHILATRRHEFAARGIRLLLSPTHAVALCLDRWQLLAAASGICPIPDSAIIDSSFTPDRLGFPFVVRVRRVGQRGGARIIDDSSDVRDWPRDGSLIAQERLAGAEFSVDVLCTPDGDVLATVPRERLRTASGVAVVGRTVRDARLESIAARLAKRIGVTYGASMRFREDRDGTPKLLEVRARFSGTMPVTVASGVNMPRLALEMALGHAIDGHLLHYEEVGIVRTWQDLAVPIVDLRAMEDQARQPRVT
jgi:carbamoyl-phosphate synthase large subunit